MPLSEHEQRLLDEMERNLYGGNSDVHAASSSGRPNYRFVVLGVVVCLAGVGLLIAGVMSKFIVLGVAGFVVIIAGVLLALRRDRRERADSKSERPAGGAKRGFMERMERRWDTNQEDRL